MAKRGNPAWQKGVSGNPKGKPRSPEVQAFLEAKRTVEASKKKLLYIHAIEQAYVDNAILTVVLRKFVPDKIDDSDPLSQLARTFLVRGNSDPKP